MARDALRVTAENGLPGLRVTAGRIAVVLLSGGQERSPEAS